MPGQKIEKTAAFNQMLPRAKILGKQTGSRSLPASPPQVCLAVWKINKPSPAEQTRWREAELHYSGMTKGGSFVNNN